MQERSFVPLNIIAVSVTVACLHSDTRLIVVEAIREQELQHDGIPRISL